MLLAVGAIKSRISMREGSKASASRARLGRTPSIHRVSAFDKEERSLAKQGQRLDHAAAGAEHLVPLVRDDHAGPGARGDVIDDLIGQIMHVDDSFACACVAEGVSLQKKVAANSLQRRGVCRESLFKTCNLLRCNLAQRHLRDRELRREVVVKAAGLGGASGLNVARRHGLLAHFPE
jgi:hypothetical protein